MIKRLVRVGVSGLGERCALVILTDFNVFCVPTAVQAQVRLGWAAVTERAGTKGHVPMRGGLHGVSHPGVVTEAARRNRSKPKPEGWDGARGPAQPPNSKHCSCVPGV